MKIHELFINPHSVKCFYALLLYRLFLKYSGVELFLVSSGPEGGEGDTKINDISLSKDILSIAGVQ